ncbi:MAG: hypothetical protein ACI4P5_02185, partial [Candidatus Fimadaptatus sp.]
MPRSLHVFQNRKGIYGNKNMQSEPFCANQIIAQNGAICQLQGVAQARCAAAAGEFHARKVDKRGRRGYDIAVNNYEAAWPPVERWIWMRQYTV